MSKDVFVSYSSKDEDVVKSVLKIFDEEKISYWFAPEQLEGEKHDEEIIPAIQSCKVFLIFLSQYSRPRFNIQASKWVRAELLTAVDYDKCILPIKLDETVDEPTDNLTFRLLPNYIDFKSFEHSIAMKRVYSIIQDLLNNDNYKRKELEVQKEKETFVEKLFKEVEQNIKDNKMNFAKKTLEENKILFSKKYKSRKIFLEVIIEMSEKPIKDMVNTDIKLIIEKLRYIHDNGFECESYFLEAMIAQSYFEFNGLYNDQTEEYNRLLQMYKLGEKISHRIFLLSKNIKNTDKGFMLNWM